MSQPELLVAVARFLEAAGIGYMVTGSIVSSLQGEPRATHDVDFVVSIAVPDISRLQEAFPAPRYYVDSDAAEGAIDHAGMFNMIDTTSGDKADFWLLTNEPFDASRFGRRHTIRFMDTNLSVPSPEDTILMKLKWAKMSGGSEKQFSDALHVFEIQLGELDQDYLRHWVKMLGLEDLWTRLTDEAQPLDVE